MSDSILTSIKKLLGLEEDYTAFDTDITIHINSAFSTIQQLGVGPSEGFRIVDKNEKWSDYLLDKEKDMIKSYIYLKVRLVFDPPASSYGITAIKNEITEYEWRINSQEEGFKIPEEVPNG